MSLNCYMVRMPVVTVSIGVLALGVCVAQGLGLEVTVNGKLTNRNGKPLNKVAVVLNSDGRWSDAESNTQGYYNVKIDAGEKMELIVHNPFDYALEIYAGLSGAENHRINIVLERKARGDATYDELEELLRVAQTLRMLPIGRRPASFVRTFAGAKSVQRIRAELIRDLESQSRTNEQKVKVKATARLLLESLDALRKGR
jgi:hypothetical protein